MLLILVYIRFGGFADWSAIVDALIRHEETLQRVVLHDFDGPGYQYTAHLEPDGSRGLTANEHYDCYWRENVNKLLKCRKLRAVGLTPYPEFLVWTPSPYIAVLLTSISSEIYPFLARDRCGKYCIFGVMADYGDPLG